MRSNLCRWGVEHGNQALQTNNWTWNGQRYVIQPIMMYYKPLKSPAGCMVLKWRLGAKLINIANCAEVELRVQYTATCVVELSTIFTCYAACVNGVKLVYIRNSAQYYILCGWGQFMHGWSQFIHGSPVITTWQMIYL